MNAPFNVGDVVVCVDDRKHEDQARYLAYHSIPYPIPPVGSVHRVDGVQEKEGMFGLLLEDFPPIVLPDGEVRTHAAERFRHLPKADEQFIAQMRALTLVKRSVDA